MFILYYIKLLNYIAELCTISKGLLLATVSFILVKTAYKSTADDKVASTGAFFNSLRINALQNGGFALLCDSTEVWIGQDVQVLRVDAQLTF